jgi:signal transduction histidine kinase
MVVSQTARLLPWFSGSMTKFETTRSISQKLRPWFIVIVTTAFALAIDLAMGTFASEATDALYIMAAAAGAYAGGFRFGLLSIGFGLLPNIALHNSPHYSLAVGAYGWEHVSVTSVIAAALAYLVGRLRKEQHALQAFNNELEVRVSRRTAELEESNRQLEAFCHTLAHDLRAPLRAIQGFAQITLAENGDQISDDGKQIITRIGNSAEMMGRLIHDLLGYTQIQRSKVALMKTSLQEVVERVLAIVAPEIHVKNAVIEVDSPLPFVTSDSTLLEQIILSIVSNALKFSHENTPPHIHIRAESTKSTVRLLVEDNGIGIPPQYQEQIFGPFQRLDSRAKYPGTGMGLAIAKKSLERLRGTIAVKSLPGEGSCFSIELPKS